MTAKDHHYAARTVWEGNRGAGTASYDGYERGYRVVIAGKPDLCGSADPDFRGDPSKHNPEDLLLASVSACHMLTYLALCARSGVRVLAYEDEARAVMREDGAGGGQFTDIVLRPVVTVAGADDVGGAMRLHQRAHALCFIANSCRVPIRHEPVVRIAEGVGA